MSPFWSFYQILIFLVIFQFPRGESYSRQYRILSGDYYYPSYRYYDGYRITSPSKSYYVKPPSYYQDDNVYITDKYGQTTVVNKNSYYQRAALTSPQISSLSLPSGNLCAKCGQNAQCAIVDGRPVCSCLRSHIGDPLSSCKRVECLSDYECGPHQMCKNDKCVNPCDGVCGINANCEVRLHVPVCSCPSGYTGNPSLSCRRFDPAELCHPSPCGVNTNCEVINETPTCKCSPGYKGDPITGCRHECDADSDCGSQMACIDYKCQNPCYTQCGQSAQCQGVRNHQAICVCPEGWHGNPFSACRAECYADSDCPRNKPACFITACKNPCDNACGIGANCELRGLTPICSCPKDMTGDPFVRCRPFTKEDLCEPNPCGSNAKCTPGYDRSNNERPVCTCPVGYVGNPLTSCTPGECTDDSQCGDHRACIDYACVNPCHGQCGVNAECNPRRHIAVCTCPNGYNGDALVSCHRVQSTPYYKK
ncbi:neurogenic locus notch homolog protein 1 isoform X1 [Onthophagus taurus]|uniref:neurogenic locus notch homolog protein 1 isoform X1 n=1 Tax=Onthophagus taurus TaxID=166361 RepID=UPI0039BDD20C